MSVNVFNDQERFMVACGQTVDHFNADQLKLYVELIREEFQDELLVALETDNKQEILDALLDILVVTVGALHSMGADGAGGWQEVMRSNFAKIDPLTGLVTKRADGKVLKGPDWTPPHLVPYLNK